MDDAVIGSIVLTVALVLTIYLTFLSLRTINMIADKGLKSAREILKEIRGD